MLQHIATGSGDLVSGVADDERASLHARFVEALERARPEAMAAVREQQAERETGLAAIFRAAEAEGAAASGGGFSFNFA